MSQSDKIKIAIKELQSLFLAKRYLKKLDEKMKSNQHSLALKENEIEKEYKDISLLESLSMNSLFRVILGDKSEQLELARQEYLKAILDYKDFKKQKELLEFEYKIINEKTQNLELKEKELADLNKERNTKLKTKESNEQSIFLKLYTQLDNHQKLYYEIRSAYEIGIDCTDSVTLIIKKLNQAIKLRNWNPIKNSTNYKYEKSVVDESVIEYNKLKLNLLRFEDELADIYIQKKIKIQNQLHRFESILEGYYNYLINDWIVRKRISSALNMMEALKDDLHRVTITLEREANHLENDIHRLEKQKQELFLK